MKESAIRVATCGTLTRDPAVNLSTSSITSVLREEKGESRTMPAMDGSLLAYNNAVTAPVA